MSPPKMIASPKFLNEGLQQTGLCNSGNDNSAFSGPLDYCCTFLCLILSNAPLLVIMNQGWGSNQTRLIPSQHSTRID